MQVDSFAKIRPYQLLPLPRAKYSSHIHDAILHAKDWVEAARTASSQLDKIRSDHVHGHAGLKELSRRCWGSFCLFPILQGCSRSLTDDDHDGDRIDQPTIGETG